MSHVLRESAPGTYGGSLSLEPGIYRYKFLVDCQYWMQDRSNPWTDHTDDFANSTLVVGGSEPPLFFAPCRQCWVLLDGQLTIYAEVAVDASVPQRVFLLDANGREIAENGLLRAQRIGNRILVQYSGPVPASATTARFEGYPGEWHLPPPTMESLPAWLRQGTVYSIFVDRWHRGIKATADARAVPRNTPSTADVIFGGDLTGITESVHHFEQLGADAICLTPIHESESPHRYDAHSIVDVDARLGGEEALRELIRVCHAHKLHIVLDAAFTHCHANHDAFRHVLEHQNESIYRDWFHIDHFPVSLDDPSSFRHYPGHPDLPLFDLSSLPVIEHFKQKVQHWMQLGVDGLRFDAVEYGPASIWRELVCHAKAFNPDVAMIAECVSASPYWAHQALSVHTATDYAGYEQLLQVLATRQAGTELYFQRRYLHQHRTGPELDQVRLSFIDNHDTDRFLTQAGSLERLRAALVYLLLRPEPALFLYGSEFALSSHRCTHERDSPWPDRMPMPPLDQNTDFSLWVRALLCKRRALRRRGFAEARPLDTPNGIIGYERTGRSGSLRVMVNVTEEPQAIAAHDNDGSLYFETGTSLRPTALAARSAMAIYRRASS